MTPALHHAAPPAVLHRFAYGPDPWAWRDWSYAHDDGTFGNRYDDPDGRYRVLYACVQRVGTFIEVLARFRPDPAVVAELAAIDGEDDTSPAGSVERAWLARRLMGNARVGGRFADVGHSESLAHLNRTLCDVTSALGLEELDAAAVRRAEPRSLTQRISREVYNQTARSGARRFDGIRYLSRLGDDLVNWALFEPADLDPVAQPAGGVVTPEDPDLVAAMHLHGLTWC